MFMDDLSIKFQGFHPSEFTRSYLNEKMSALHNGAPYGSRLKAVFTRDGHIFKGVVSIRSSAGKFFATASGSKLKEVTHRLVGQIRKQLSRWKSQRFERDSLKDLSVKDNENSNSENANLNTDSVA